MMTSHLYYRVRKLLAKSCKKDVAMMEDEIIRLYFEEKLKQKDIAEKLKISKYKVSRVVSKDKRYKLEKENRKMSNKKIHDENTKKFMKNKREIEKRKNTSDDLILREMHRQASMEMSKGNKLSDMAYRNWNTSAYKYNNQKKRFEFREELGRSYDVKKFLKGKIQMFLIGLLIGFCIGTVIAIVIYACIIVAKSSDEKIISRKDNDYE